MRYIAIPLLALLLLACVVCRTDTKLSAVSHNLADDLDRITDDLDAGEPGAIDRLRYRINYLRIWNE